EFPMQLLSNLSIRFKVLTIVAGGIAGLIVTLAFNYNATSSNKVTLESVQNIYFPVLERLDANLVRLDKIKENYTTAVIAGDEDILEENAELSQQLTQALTEVAEMDSAEHERIDLILNNFTAYTQTADVVSLGMIEETLDLEAAQPMLKKMNAQLTTTEEGLNNFRGYSYQRFTGAIDGANDASAEALITSIVVGLATALLLGVVGVLIGNSITRNISAVIHSLKEMASGEGDLTTRLRSDSNDEIGTLVEEFNAFVAKLQGVISEVTGSTARVATAAGEMKHVSEMSVVGMNSQQQEINQVVTAMAEMTRSVEGVSDSASRAASTASTASTEADAGKRVVEENMQAISSLAEEVENAAEVIQELESHSEAIGKVLNVIRDIAEQTNLLALNAAIEAARAGEQGRGFAVVADEVRTLATRTHDSTREVHDLINHLQTGTKNAVQTMVQGREQAQASVTQAARVGESLQRIAQGVNEISAMNEQIANAAEEQRAVTQEINNNIVNLGQVVNQVTQDARTAEGDSEKLAQLAEQLRAQISVFRI
ncbi:MAG TPA: methyl-accepting chemotaxis protein, partial [Chromatiales bacterium]|nr:methyl-accepting chemotaxis protein [Chromatiales bacterium]